MKTGFILNKEESCFCLRAYGQRKCCVLMFVQNLEGTELSCFKIKAQKPTKTGMWDILTPAGLRVSSQLREVAAPGQVGSGSRGDAPPTLSPLLTSSLRCVPCLWPPHHSKAGSPRREPQPIRGLLSRTCHGGGHGSQAGRFPLVRSHHQA